MEEKTVEVGVGRERHLYQGSKLTYVRQSVTDKNPGGHIDFFTYQSDLAYSD
jgi:hypothetical protein